MHGITAARQGRDFDLSLVLAAFSAHQSASAKMSYQRIGRGESPARRPWISGSGMGNSTTPIQPGQRERLGRPRQTGTARLPTCRQGRCGGRLNGAPRLGSIAMPFFPAGRGNWPGRLFSVPIRWAYGKKPSHRARALGILRKKERGSMPRPHDSAVYPLRSRSAGMGFLRTLEAKGKESTYNTKPVKMMRPAVV